ncbi:hypothetical protein ACVITL_000935 [Rhizobium pisi]|jgi:hypothetical protein
MRRIFCGAALALLFPVVGLTADNWLEKVFPDPEDCLSQTWSIFFSFDEGKLVVMGFPNAEIEETVKNNIASADVVLKGQCKGGAALDQLRLKTEGSFFGNQYFGFEVPVSGYSNGGCDSSASYSILFRKPAVAVRGEIEKQTGKRLEIYSPSSPRTGDVDEMPGYIFDRGDRSEYVCSFAESN